MIFGHVLRVGVYISVKKVINSSDMRNIKMLKLPLLSDLENVVGILFFGIVVL